MNSNPHVMELCQSPEGEYYKAVCTAPDCGTVLYVGALSEEAYASMFKSHRDQYEPGRAPDIEVGWEPTADCSVCESGGDVDVNDDGDLCCRECGSCWTINGTFGYRADVDR